MIFKRTENGIYYLHIYYPVRYEEHKGISESILSFKKGHQKAIDDFTKELKDALLNEADADIARFEGRCVVIVPSHSKGCWSSSMMKVASELCEEFDMLNYSTALIRIMEHEKLACGGNRSIESHIKTIKFDTDYDIADKIVIILDDVTTTGGSILACKRILEAANAKKVSAIAIAKTY